MLGLMYLPERSLCTRLHPAVFVAAACKTPLDHLALVANGAYASRPQKTVTNGERDLSQLPSPWHTERQQIEVPSPPVKGSSSLSSYLWP